MGAVSQVAYLANYQTATSSAGPAPTLLTNVSQGLSGVTTGAMTPPSIDSPPCSSGGEGSALSGIPSWSLHIYPMVISVFKIIHGREKFLDDVNTNVAQLLQAVAPAQARFPRGSQASWRCASPVGSPGGSRLSSQFSTLCFIQ